MGKCGRTVNERTDRENLKYVVLIRGERCEWSCEYRQPVQSGSATEMLILCPSLQSRFRKCWNNKKIFPFFANTSHEGAKGEESGNENKFSQKGYSIDKLVVAREQHQTSNAVVSQKLICGFLDLDMFAFSLCRASGDV